MSYRNITATTVQIHPRALKSLGLEASLVMLGVARDLRSGAIPPEEYDQTEWCGSACCIAGHTATRLNVVTSKCASARNAQVYRWASEMWGEHDRALLNLFHPLHPSDPLLAADAIERYVLHGSDRPWRPRPQDAEGAG